MMTDAFVNCLLPNGDIHEVYLSKTLVTASCKWDNVKRKKKEEKSKYPCSEGS